MNAAMDELVEKAARAIYVHDTPIGSHDPEWPDVDRGVQRLYADSATAALEAVGLPALLERVKAAEGALAEMRSQRQ